MYLLERELKIKERAIAVKDRRNDLIERMQAQLATISDNREKPAAPVQQPPPVKSTNSSAAASYTAQSTENPAPKPQPGQANRNDNYQ